MQYEFTEIVAEPLPMRSRKIYRRLEPQFDFDIDTTPNRA